MSNVEINQQGRLARRKNSMAWTFVLMLMAVLVLPLSGYVYQGMSASAHADSATWQNENPRSNYWRSVRAGDEGYTSMKNGDGVLIQSAGQTWRELRNGPVMVIGALGMLVSLAALVWFHFVKGPVKLEQPRSGQLIERWTRNERIMHWTVASLFVILGITGLSLLYGRTVLIPILGAEGFAGFADFAKLVHNYLGPLFVIAVVVLVLTWFKNNIITEDDKQWLRSGGGLFGGVHAKAGKLNGGEKLWFWLIATAGIAVCISGLVMDFPNMGWSRSTMQNANIIHSALALIWIAAAFGHIYIGTAGSEGSLEAMTTGHVDAEWAKQHHDLWHEEVKATAKPAASSVSSEGVQSNS